MKRKKTRMTRGRKEEKERKKAQKRREEVRKNESGRSKTCRIQRNKQRKRI